VSKLNIPEEKQKIATDYAKYARRILWLDEDVVKGAFHMNTSWYLKAAVTLENTFMSTILTRLSVFSVTTPRTPTT
jgi:hypothetical protein